MARGWPLANQLPGPPATPNHAVLQLTRGEHRRRRVRADIHIDLACGPCCPPTHVQHVATQPCAPTTPHPRPRTRVYTYPHLYTHVPICDLTARCRSLHESGRESSMVVCHFMTPRVYSIAMLSKAPAAKVQDSRDFSRMEEGRRQLRV